MEGRAAGVPCAQRPDIMDHFTTDCDELPRIAALLYIWCIAPPHRMQCASRPKIHKYCLLLSSIVYPVVSSTQKYYLPISIIYSVVLSTKFYSFQVRQLKVNLVTQDYWMYVSLLFIIVFYTQCDVVNVINFLLYGIMMQKKYCIMLQCEILVNCIWRIVHLTRSALTVTRCELASHSSL